MPLASLVLPEIGIENYWIVADLLGLAFRDQSANFLIGVLDRAVGHRRVVLLVTQLVAAGLMVTMALGAPGFLLAKALHLSRLPVVFDIGLLLVIGLLVCVQPLIYAMARQIVAVQDVGKALSAVNLAFFLGTAVMQSVTGLISTAWGIPAALIAMAIFLFIGTISFFFFTRPATRH